MASEKEACEFCGSVCFGVSAGTRRWQCGSEQLTRTWETWPVRQSRDCMLRQVVALGARVRTLEAALREIAALQGHSAAYDLLNDVRTIAEAALRERKERT